MKRYTPMYRHAFNGRLPLSWQYVEIPAEFGALRPDLPRSRERFGIITFDCDLTPEEVATHELREVSE